MRKDPTDFRKRFNQWKAGVKVYDAGRSIDDYENFKKTLPENQRNTSEYEYSTRRYWELNGKPKNFNEAVEKGMYELKPDGWHARSVMETPQGDYEFMKPNVHPTKWMEDAFYDSDKLFQKEYRRTLDWTRPGFSKYERNTNPLDHINLPKYDTGEPDDKTYVANTGRAMGGLPGVVVTPSGSLSEADYNRLNYSNTLYTHDKPLSPVDPIGAMIVEGAALGPIFKGLGWLGKTAYKAALPYIGKVTKPFTNYFAAKALSNSIDNAVKSTGITNKLVLPPLPNYKDVYENVPNLPGDFKIKGNFVNRILTKNEISKYSDLILAEQEASNFLKRDVYPRFSRNTQVNYDTYRGSYDGSNGIDPNMKIYYANFSKTPLGGYQGVNTRGVPYIAADPEFNGGDYRTLSRVLTHEIEHYYNQLKNKGLDVVDLDRLKDNEWADATYKYLSQQGRGAYSDITPTGKTEYKLLSDAYIYDSDPRWQPWNINRTKERAATNREIRQRISQENGNVYFEDLDNIIDNMSDEDLMEILRTENGYSKSFYNNLTEAGKLASQPILQNIRNALKYVPAITPFAVGTHTSDEYDKGKSIKPSKKK